MRGKKARAIRKKFGVPHVRLAGRAEYSDAYLKHLKEKARKEKAARGNSKPVVEK